MELSWYVRLRALACEHVQVISARPDGNYKKYDDNSERMILERKHNNGYDMVMIITQTEAMTMIITTLKLTQ